MINMQKRCERQKLTPLSRPVRISGPFVSKAIPTVIPYGSFSFETISVAFLTFSIVAV